MNRLQFAAAWLFAVPVAALPQTSGDQAIEWTSSVVAVAGLGHTYELRLEGRIASGYIVYGPDFEVDIGPRPVRLKLDAQDGLTARGPLRATETRRRHDPVFNGEYSYLQGVAKLSQQLDVKPGTARVAGTVRGQTCREADGTCSLFSYRFEVDLP